MCPLPVDIDDFKAVFKYTGKEYLTKHINDMNIINFKKVQDLYNNLYVKKYYEKKNIIVMILTLGILILKGFYLTLFFVL